MGPRAFYHFTCLHRARSIERSRELRPNRHPLLGHRLVWLTDLPEPDRWGLGLTSAWLTCDRTAVRVSVQPNEGIVRWPAWALWHKVPHALVDLLEEGARPEHWWVSTERLPVSDVSPAVHLGLRRTS
ncbi:hypothetical protein [Amycolatopsis sp. NPDC059021]|uniref:hypothetical protein n=1 Tax=Amycolatopsis sp. NPDC059021 TaxID=3346704 RepID=UPI00366F5D9A